METEVGCQFSFRAFLGSYGEETRYGRNIKLVDYIICTSKEKYCRKIHYPYSFLSISCDLEAEVDARPFGTRVLNNFALHTKD